MLHAINHLDTRSYTEINMNALRVTSSGIKRRVVRCADRRFGGMYRLHLQGRRLSQVKRQNGAGSKQTICSSDRKLN
jgi:hypothetical protein